MAISAMPPGDVLGGEHARASGFSIVCMGYRIHAIVLLLLAGCATPFPMPEIPAIEGRVAALLPADAILLGEQHDAPTHQEMHRRAIEALGARGALAAVALEMADQGRSTAGLPRDAGEAAVRTALQWSDAGWPWQAYGPAVMAAVRAGVPVIGANLPRSQMRPAMADAALDTAVPDDVLQAQRAAVREGHCGLLPDRQIAPMARVQIARDRTMAQAIAQAAVPGKTVVLLAGAGHVDATLGVARHLPPALRVRAELLPPEPPKKDYCIELREQLKGKPTP
jgi:uncharacterized iron-regulated protein